MPAHTPTQKIAIQQFIGITNVKESAAAKQLKNNNWNLQNAVNAPADQDLPNARFYQGSNASSTPSQAEQNLNKLFDKYRDNAREEPDAIGVEGCMRYLGDLGLSLEEPVVLAVLTELDAPTMGELTRKGFVDGWKKHRASDMPTQISHLSSLRQHLPTPSLAPTSTFHRTYRHTFRLALTTGQRTLPLDTAVEYFRLLLAPPGLAWNTPTTPWLDLWLEYLTEKWKKAINKDVWEQTGVFVVKSLEDESMGWWSEEGAWPSCLDEFVAFVRSRRGEGQGGEGDGMEL
ncbi:MAG: hypothetical protein Q9206_001716 [Seirophora lacunosa]